MTSMRASPGAGAPPLRAASSSGAGEIRLRASARPAHGGTSPVGPGPTEDVDPPITVDVRLLPAAVAAWLTALVVVRVSPHAALVGAAVCLALGAGILLVSGRGSPSRDGTTHDRHGPSSSGVVGPVVVLSLVAAAAVLGAGASQVVARDEGLLPVLARDGAVGRIEGVVVGEPTVLPPAWPGAPDPWP